MPWVIKPTIGIAGLVAEQKATKVGRFDADQTRSRTPSMRIEHKPTNRAVGRRSGSNLPVRMLARRKRHVTGNLRVITVDQADFRTPGENRCAMVGALLSVEGSRGCAVHVVTRDLPSQLVDDSRVVLEVEGDRVTVSPSLRRWRSSRSWKK